MRAGWVRALLRDVLAWPPTTDELTYFAIGLALGALAALALVLLL